MKIGHITMLLTSLFILLGCTDNAILKIMNNTDYDDVWYSIKNEIVYIDAGNFTEIEYELSTSIFGAEEKKISLVYGGKFVVTQELNISLTPGKTKEIEILTNAGEIIVLNYSYSFYIKEVYISPHSDDEWGDNDLSGVIGPGQSVSWYVTPGSWDIKIVDDWDIELDFFADVELEETIVFTYYGSKSTGDSNELKIANAQKTTQSIEDRVQQNEK